jgi:hypothetical protein
MAIWTPTSFRLARVRWVFLDVANHDAFGDLQAHRAGFDAEFIDAVRDSADEAIGD